MIMCSNCNKRPAVVFITSVQGNEKKNEGLCLSCARKRDIPQVAEYMNRLGITDEELDQLSDSMMGMLDGDAFEMGGSGLMPDFHPTITAVTVQRGFSTPSARLSATSAAETAVTRARKIRRRKDETVFSAAAARRKERRN